MTNEELVKYIRQGNNELMGKLYDQNKPVIRMTAERLTHSADEYEDALQDAYFGLVEAVKGFDESMGYKFITYAKYHLKTSINRGKANIQPIPEYLTNRARKIRQAENELSQQLQRAPTKAEIAIRTGFSVKEIKHTLRVIKPPVTIDAPLSEDFTIADTIADNSIDFENDIAEADEQRNLHNVVEGLPNQVRQAMQLYYFQRMTYKQAAEKLNLSPERVRQLIDKGLRYLRHPKMIQKITDEELDRRTSFYRHRGVQCFNNTWTSSTEQSVLERERMRSADIERRVKEILTNANN